MDKNLVEQIQSYYEKNNQNIFKKFKEESSNNDSEQNYINYCQKCYNNIRGIRWKRINPKKILERLLN